MEMSTMAWPAAALALAATAMVLLGYAFAVARRSASGTAPRPMVAVATRDHSRGPASDELAAPGDITEEIPTVEQIELSLQAQEHVEPTQALNLEDLFDVEDASDIARTTVFDASVLSQSPQRQRA